MLFFFTKSIWRLIIHLADCEWQQSLTLFSILWRIIGKFLSSTWALHLIHVFIVAFCFILWSMVCTIYVVHIIPVVPVVHVVHVVRVIHNICVIHIVRKGFDNRGRENFTNGRTNRLINIIQIFKLLQQSFSSIA